MKTVAVLSQKGGAGKTTLAIHLAVAAQQAGHPALLIDLDPQASATVWKDLRTDKTTPSVISAQPSRLRQVLEAAKAEGIELAVIDTAPHSESPALAAARAADLILIPCRPAVLDLYAIGSTVNVVSLARKPAQIVLNAVPPRGSLADEARAAVKDYEVPVAPCTLGHRAAFVHALTQGQSVQEHSPYSIATQEITRFYQFAVTQVGL